MKALLLENIHPEGVRLLTERGIEVETVKGALDEAELIDALRGVQLLGIRSKTNVTGNVLESAAHLLAVGAFCIGTNQIDLAAASRLGIPVFNAPFSNTRSVVELVIAEIIALARHLTDKNAKMHAGIWDKSAKGAHEVRGRTLGIVGYGNIGSQLSVVAESIGMRVYFYDVADKLALGNTRRCETLDELLEVAETVTLHVDGRPGNAGLFGAEQFAKMRRRSLFLNLCRGFVVDHEALREHLLSGHIAGAALDVFADEPKSARRRKPTSAGSWRGSYGTTPTVGTPRCRSTCPRCRPAASSDAAGCCMSTTTCRGCWLRSTACWRTLT
jgi:D-3-phosphoglycerate dehydrogenase / 2-oxoglutarate reductase